MRLTSRSEDEFISCALSLSVHRLACLGLMVLARFPIQLTLRMNSFIQVFLSYSTVYVVNTVIDFSLKDE